MNEAAETALRSTRCWLQRIVIDLNLCPFAAGPVRRDTVLFRVCTAPDFDRVYRGFLEALQQLWMSDPGEAETALLICTSALTDFEEYLDALVLLETAVVDAGLEGAVQLASFHPDYRFAGSDVHDPANFTNRSPYPMFHLIREKELEQALAAYADPAEIPERNVRRLRALGEDGIRALLDEC